MLTKLSLSLLVFGTYQFPILPFRDKCSQDHNPGQLHNYAQLCTIIFSMIKGPLKGSQKKGIDWHLVEVLEERHCRVIPVLGVKPVDEEANTLQVKK